VKYISKLKHYIWLNYVLLFKKENFLRNFLFMENEIKKFSKDNTTGDIQDLLVNIFTLKKSRLNDMATDRPFNGQHIRKNIIEDLILKIGFEEIVETGTYLGNTTEFFSKFNIQVDSVEISELYYMFSRSRFLNYKNINLFNTNSIEYLQNKKMSDKKILFYLDAHSMSRELPLAKELDVCLQFKNAVILIDDFKVPGNLDFGFDVYNGVELAIENFNNLDDSDLYFPNYSPKESGARGYLLIDVSKNYKKVFNDVENLVKIEKSTN